MHWYIILDHEIILLRKILYNYLHFSLLIFLNHGFCLLIVILNKIHLRHMLLYQIRVNFFQTILRKLYLFQHIFLYHVFSYLEVILNKLHLSCIYKCLLQHYLFRKYLKKYHRHLKRVFLFHVVLIQNINLCKLNHLRMEWCNFDPCLIKINMNIKILDDVK